jgi:hypothetical protein
MLSGCGVGVGVNVGVGVAEALTVGEAEGTIVALAGILSKTSVVTRGPLLAFGAGWYNPHPLSSKLDAIMIAQIHFARALIVLSIL